MGEIIKNTKKLRSRSFTEQERLKNKKKKKNDLRILLYPIKDEENEQNFIDKIFYKKIATKCFRKIKVMKIDIKKGLRLISKHKLIEVINDIEALRSGNYIAIE